MKRFLLNCIKKLAKRSFKAQKKNPTAVGRFVIRIVGTPGHVNLITTFVNFIKRAVNLDIVIFFGNHAPRFYRLFEDLKSKKHKFIVLNRVFRQSFSYIIHVKLVCKISKAGPLVPIRYWLFLLGNQIKLILN